MDQIRCQDATQFEKIVRDYQSMVYGIAYNFTHDMGISEELAQDTFLHLYRNLQAIESISHLENWLRRTVIHRCIDYSRRCGSRVQVALDDLQEPIASPMPGDFLLLEKVRQLVANLPERYRAIVILRFQEELEPQDIATLLQVPVNTVKSRLQRAINVLRHKLENTLRGGYL